MRASESEPQDRIAMLVGQMHAWLEGTKRDRSTDSKSSSGIDVVGHSF
jgi:hypothetical protein